MCIKGGYAAQRGLTLIELLIFIIVISVGLVGILAVMNYTTKASADPMMRKQSIAMAEAVLEEVLAKPFCDPDLTPPACTASPEASRDLYDDIADYDGKTIAGTDLLAGANTAQLAGYSAAIALSDVTINGIAMKKVTVTVTGGAEPFALSGYRANY